MNVFNDAYKNRPFLFGKNATEELLFVIDRFEIQGNALELGCGDGRDTWHVLNKGLCVTAVDQSIEAIKTLNCREDITSKERRRLITLCQDVNSLQLEKSQYEFVYSITLLDHLSVEDSTVLIEKSIRALKENGYMFVKVHTTDDVGNTHMAKEVSEFACEIKHFYSHEELLEKMSNYGRIVYYLEATELDLDHGAPHTHAFASILVRKDK